MTNTDIESQYMDRRHLVCDERGVLYMKIVGCGFAVFVTVILLTASAKVKLV